tara:strand:+ start:370 stop:723 length:354 start_codon:yes stop_codon:yes gene_type:complete
MGGTKATNISDGEELLAIAKKLNFANIGNATKKVVDEALWLLELWVSSGKKLEPLIAYGVWREIHCIIERYVVLGSEIDLDKMDLDTEFENTLTENHKESLQEDLKDLIATAVKACQ